MVRNYKFELKSIITISSLAKAVENQGFYFLQGNQERTKILTKEGILVTQGKKEVYHLYVTPKQGSFKSFDFPRKILLSVNGAPYPIEYAVRNCRELGGDIKNLCIHAGPKGCKGYNKEYALAFQPPLRICVCAEEKAARLEREERKRMAPPKKTIQEALNPDKPELCKRFPNGKCPMNIVGKACNRSHDYPGAWKDGACTIVCAFPRASGRPESDIRAIPISMEIYTHGLL